jgi:hypothetical protein
MSVIDLLLDLFRSEDAQQELANDPATFLAENVPEGLTAEQVLAAMPGVCAALPPEQAESLRTAYGLSGAGAAAGGGGGPSHHIDPGSGPAGPPPLDPGGDPVEQVLQQLNYYTNVVNTTNQTFEDNDVTNIDDRDTTVDNSVNQNITAFGDVNQDFDNDVVSGDGAAAAGDHAQVNTGDGAVQAGEDIEDSNVVTGNVTDSVLADDISDSVVGDGNQVIDDSIVGAASFGDGDATNVEAENALLGDGTLVEGGGGDITLNQGDGDVTQIDDSDLSESVVGDGIVQSNDVAITAEEGSAVAFGDGSSATADTQQTTIEDNTGTVQVADDGTQTGATDNSVNDSENVTDSGNYDVYAVDNSVDASVDYSVDGSYNDSSDNSLDASVTDNSGGTTNVDVHDNDGIDIL